MCTKYSQRGDVVLSGCNVWKVLLPLMHALITAIAGQYNNRRARRCSYRELESGGFQTSLGGSSLAKRACARCNLAFVLPVSSQMQLHTLGSLYIDLYRYIRKGSHWVLS